MAALLESVCLRIRILSFQTPSAPPNPKLPLVSSPNLVHYGLVRSTPKALRKARKMSATSSAQPAIHCIDSSTVSLMSESFILFREIGLSEKETVALFQKSSVLETATPESLRKRLISLQSSGIIDFALCRLIAKCPEVLVADEVDTFIEFLLESLEGILPEKLERLLLTTQPHYFVEFAKKVELCLDNGIPRAELAPLLNRINLRAFCYRKLEDLRNTLIFLKSYGVSTDWIVRRPLLLALDLNTQLVPRAAVFTELGGPEKATELLRKFPPILAYTVDHLETHIDFWRSIGLTDEQLFKIALIYPNVFSIGKDNKLKSRVEFLKQCGLITEDIYKFLTKAPLFLSLSWKKNLSKKLGLLVKLGYEHGTRELAWALGAVTRTSCQNLQLVIGSFLSYGLSLEDILAMSKKHPPVLQYNNVSLESKMEYLIEGIGRDIGELLAFPAFLGYRLDERIKHRYEAKKDTRGEGMSLIKLLTVSTERFANKKKSSTRLDANAA
ncbi:transcription termination factor MTERF8, chloroplastic isoform X1 [Aristolochia californica]|uniref:transcription termination factor MTERF8, chloroplastic isoform X1 n=1 Tax=Aristolochia californica TaxID=171875 RepID=UPI0035D7DCB0